MEENKEPIVAEVAEEKPELNPLETELTELKDKYLRLAAEMENVKRRSKIDADSAARTKMLNLAENILPVVDAARAALKHSPEDEGIKMILSNVIEALAKSGIAPIATMGEKLNPMFHQAISTLKSESPSGIIIEELQGGFMFEGQALRPAMVIVAE
ncbi:MAG: nucleotide exchange factor GrpE [Rickettsiales bacterium]|jgi:molecular chaperone GrpE|nr:nucleotide exchange factor GrpE [Rickettsiales bacterium]